MGRTTCLLLGALALATAVARGQDPIQVDAKHYKLEYQNDQVRVLRINYGPNEKSVMHEHPAGVAIFLTDQQGKFTFPDGKTEQQNMKAGQVQWTPQGKHLPESSSDKPFELILVEMKAKPGTVSATVAQDPVKLDPKHYKVEMENDQVRVLRINYGPHEKSVMHDHPAGVMVFLGDARAKFTLADGKAEERSFKAGEARWLPAEKHLPESLVDKPFELILIELKKKPATT